jgi:hypothetical protein
LESHRDRRDIVSRNIGCPFKYPPGMTNANFVFALHKPVTVEFMAKAVAPQSLRLRVEVSGAGEFFGGRFVGKTCRPSSSASRV